MYVVVDALRVRLVEYTGMLDTRGTMNHFWEHFGHDRGSAALVVTAWMWCALIWAITWIWTWSTHPRTWIPVVVIAFALIARRLWVTGVCAIALFVFGLLGLQTIGIFYWPAAIALFISAIRKQAQVESPTVASNPPA
jgi:hypothetical protein